MKCEYYSCDTCGQSPFSKDEDEIQTITVNFDTYVDAAGDMDTRFEVVDLCNSCLVAAMSRLVDRMPLEERMSWFERAIRGRGSDD
jgi:hypothetical protein